MLGRLTGKDAVSARQLSLETGLRQQTLSRWLQDACSLSVMPPQRQTTREWSIDEKIRILAKAGRLTGAELTDLLEREGLLLAEYEQWRLALAEEVCNDNPYSEALFLRTLKQTPVYPRLPFADLEAARRWVARLVVWYNSGHRHSAIRYVTPDERHSGADVAILARRHALYQRARCRRPERWSRNTGNWTPIGIVVLNPEPTNRELETA